MTHSVEIKIAAVASTTKTLSGTGELGYGIITIAAGDSWDVTDSVQIGVITVVLEAEVRESDITFLPPS